MIVKSGFALLWCPTFEFMRNRVPIGTKSGRQFYQFSIFLGFPGILASQHHPLVTALIVSEVLEGPSYATPVLAICYNQLNQLSVHMLGPLRVFHGFSGRKMLCGYIRPHRRPLKTSISFKIVLFLHRSFNRRYFII